MNMPRIPILSLVLATGLLSAQEPAPPANPTPKIDVAAQIAALQTPLLAVSAETAKYNATAQTWYLSSLDEMEKERTKAGDLDGVVEIQTERGRVGAMELPTAEQLKAMSVPLRRLRATYDAGLKKAAQDAARRNDLARRKCITDLEALQSRITKTGDIEQALVVKAEKERLITEFAATNPSSAVRTPRGKTFL